MPRLPSPGPLPNSLGPHVPEQQAPLLGHSLPLVMHARHLPGVINVFPLHTGALLQQSLELQQVAPSPPQDWSWRPSATARSSSMAMTATCEAFMVL